MKNISISPSNNWGDGVNLIFISRLCDVKLYSVSFYKEHPSQFAILATGSVMRFVRPNHIVWGTGSIKEDDDVGSCKWGNSHNKVYHKPHKILAVRGPKTRDKLLRMGLQVPELYGDPLILSPLVFLPKTNNSKNILGIIPHVEDKTQVQKIKFIKSKAKAFSKVKVLDIETADKPEKLISEICSCSHIISTSLHGVMLGLVYKKKVIWTEFSSNVIGNGFKFYDFFGSVNIKYAKLKYNDPNLFKNIIEANWTSFAKIGKDILQTCPFFENEQLRQKRIKEWEIYCAI